MWLNESGRGWTSLTVGRQLGYPAQPRIFRLAPGRSATVMRTRFTASVDVSSCVWIPGKARESNALKSPHVAPRRPTTALRLAPTRRRAPAADLHISQPTVSELQRQLPSR